MENSKTPQSDKRKERLERQRKLRIKRRRRRIIIVCCEIIMMLVLAIACYAVNTLNLIQRKEFDNIQTADFAATQAPETVVKEVTNAVGEVETDTQGEPETVVSQEQVLSGYTNIAVFGVDARANDELTSGVNSDVIMICSINNETGEIKLASIARDLILRLANDRRTSYGQYDKANSQMAYTDVGDELSMINLNFDLNITDYVVVNWAAVAMAIDDLGGIPDVDIYNQEFMELVNSYTDSVNRATGIWSPELTSPGVQDLTGTQAVAYCRVRYGLENGDFDRTAHQREVVMKMLDQAKIVMATDQQKLLKMAQDLLPNVATNYTWAEIMPLIFRIGSLEFTSESTTVIPQDYVAAEYVGNLSVPDPVVATDLEAEVSYLHKFLFGTEDYQPTQTVKEISDEIRNVTGVKPKTSANRQ